MSSSYQETQTNNNMKNTIKAIVFAIVSSVSALQAGDQILLEAPLPEAPVEQYNLKANAFAASLLNEDADATYGGGVSLETVSLLNVSLRGSLVAFEDETFTLGGSVLYTVPIGAGFAVYGLGGVDYEVEEERWSANAGAGATFALSEQINLFVESTYSFALDSEDEDKAWGVAAGVGIKF
jgi:hypothetical protein